MRWSRSWIVASKFLSRFPIQWRSRSYNVQPVGWSCLCHAWNEISSWFPASYWCPSIQRMWQGPLFYNDKEHIWSIILDVVAIWDLVGPHFELCISVQRNLGPQAKHLGPETLLVNYRLFSPLYAADPYSAVGWRHKSNPEFSIHRVSLSDYIMVVLCMDRVIWHYWIQWVNGPHLWIWQCGRCTLLRSTNKNGGSEYVHLPINYLYYSQSEMKKSFLRR